MYLNPVAEVGAHDHVMFHNYLVLPILMADAVKLEKARLNRRFHLRDGGRGSHQSVMYRFMFAANHVQLHLHGDKCGDCTFADAFDVGGEAFVVNIDAFVVDVIGPGSATCKQLGRFRARLVNTTEYFLYWVARMSAHNVQAVNVRGPKSEGFERTGHLELAHESDQVTDKLPDDEVVRLGNRQFDCRCLSLN
ncbi:hypothetical protein FN846DRAFT_909402 [Sphaerosporella brunnea]|uniref:Uncharacterized protein n=1 Tax=Sphaerosporella brunnea TaxID=1250544 RepID=A0A5J5EQ73_9PEZI|nr:hypothetical protein FN846DRAFT_909402 [Sphaerosporella brunnea]